MIDFDRQSDTLRTIHMIGPRFVGHVTISCAYFAAVACPRTLATLSILK